MRKLYNLFLFFYLSGIAQSNLSISKPNISVVSADKLNIVYRGVLNPISIAIPNCKSFIANGLGLKKREEEGKYYLAPGKGLYSIINIEIEFNDGSKITEEHKFRILGIAQPMATINNKSCCSECILEMTKEELYNSIFGFKFSDNLFFDVDNTSNYEINSFILIFSDKKRIPVTGKKFDKEALDKIKKLKKGSIFSIVDFGYSFPGSENYLLPRLIPIKIMIVEKEVQQNYYESKEFIRDSIRRMKNEKKLKK